MRLAMRGTRGHVMPCPSSGVTAAMDWMFLGNPMSALALLGLTAIVVGVRSFPAEVRLMVYAPSFRRGHPMTSG